MNDVRGCQVGKQLKLEISHYLIDLALQVRTGMMRFVPTYAVDASVNDGRPAKTPPLTDIEQAPANTVVILDRTESQSHS